MVGTDGFRVVAIQGVLHIDGIPVEDVFAFVGYVAGNDGVVKVEDSSGGDDDAAAPFIASGCGYIGGNGTVDEGNDAIGLDIDSAAFAVAVVLGEQTVDEQGGIVALYASASVGGFVSAEDGVIECKCTEVEDTTAELRHVVFEEAVDQGKFTFVIDTASEEGAVEAKAAAVL